jgi:MFS family permease
VYLISFWLPQIVRDLGSFSAWQVGLITAIPYGFAAAFMIWLGLRSDRTGERRWHCAVSGIVGSLALLATVWSPNVSLSVALFAVATAGIFAMMPVFWAIPPRYFAGTAAAGAIAAINSIGTLSGFVSPSIVGALKTWSGSLTPGVLVMTGLLWAGVLVLVAVIPAAKEPGRA